MYAPYRLSQLNEMASGTATARSLYMEDLINFIELPSFFLLSAAFWLAAASPTGNSESDGHAHVLAPAGAAWAGCARSLCVHLLGDCAFD